MLAKAGIEVALNAQTKGLHFAKIAKQGGLGHVVRPGSGFGPGNFDAASIHNLILRCRSDAGGTWNVAGFCDPAMDAVYDTLSHGGGPRRVRDPLLKQCGNGCTTRSSTSLCTCRTCVGRARRV